MSRVGWLLLNAADDVLNEVSAPALKDNVLVRAHHDSDSLDTALGQLLDAGVSHIVLIIDATTAMVQVDVARLVLVARTSGAGIVYSDFFEVAENGTRQLRPLIGWQLGSVRDAFDFGSLMVLDAARVFEVRADVYHEPLQFGAWYALRLALSRVAPIVHLPEPTYVRRAAARKKTGVRVFDYLRDDAQGAQLEYERIATAHLRSIGAWCPPPSATAVSVPEDETFGVTASVVIPVRDRVGTVVEAAESALSQKAGFDFNVIVVDNHSSDGTTEVLANLAVEHSGRLVHVTPERHDLGIGGCWQYAIDHAACGEYAVQLDSDDLYAASDVLARIVGAMRQDNLAFLVGSYTTVDFDLKPLPPGLVDHREWTDETATTTRFASRVLEHRARSTCRPCVRSAFPT